MKWKWNNCHLQYKFLLNSGSGGSVAGAGAGGIEDTRDQDQGREGDQWDQLDLRHSSHRKKQKTFNFLFNFLQRKSFKIFFSNNFVRLGDWAYALFLDAGLDPDIVVSRRVDANLSKFLGLLHVQMGCFQLKKFGKSIPIKCVKICFVTSGH